MKCPECDGRGYLEELLPTKFMGRFTQYKAIECSVCHGKGVVQTNEEWLRQASTEELAKVLYSVWVNGFFEQKTSVPEDINNLIIAWLKEKHDG